MSALTHQKLAQLPTKAHEQINQILEAERTEQGGYFSILPGKPLDDASTEHSDAHWLAIVHDLLGLGPAGFDEPTLEQFAGRASCFAVVSVAADLSIYRVFAGTAAVLGRVLIVETKLPLFAAWQRFLRQCSHMCRSCRLWRKGGDNDREHQAMGHAGNSTAVDP